MGSTYRGIPLKPCPFCGDDEYLAVGHHADPHVSCGRCNSCAYGMSCDERGTGPASIMAAVRRWNNRPTTNKYASKKGSNK